MPRTDTSAPTPQMEAALDDALDDSFPASDPLSSTPRRAGRDDKKAPPTGADRPQRARGMMDILRDRLNH